MGGLLTTSTTFSSGKRLEQEFGLEDPAIATGQQLAARIRSNHSMAQVRSSPTPTAKDIASVAESAQGADIVLDVRSEVFGFNYLAKNQTQFFVMNTMWARLLDVRSRTVLAEARCLPAATPPTLTLEQLLANNGERLKSGLSSYIGLCVEQLAQKMKV